MSEYNVDNPRILVVGNQKGIIQSMLDFDYLSGKKEHSLVAVVGVKQKMLRYFFGQKEILIRGYEEIADMPDELKNETNLLGIMLSGRRALYCTEQALELLPYLKLGFIFAEGVSEQDAIKIRMLTKMRGVEFFGPASVGFVMGGSYKLGAIGGILPDQITQGGTTESGDVVILSSSGGMVNELINMVSSNGSRVAYALAVGGERYPVVKPAEVFAKALADDAIKTVIYFGELGGNDETSIAALYKSEKGAKPVIAYIAGIIGEQFETPQQFGHAKSMAHSEQETASYKKELLRSVGIEVADSFLDFEQKIKAHTKTTHTEASTTQTITLPRKEALFVDRISSEDEEGVVRILGEDINSFIDNRSFTEIALSMFLGKKDVSENTRRFIDLSLRILVDHGPQVSGVVNTMIAARAGNDLAKSLSAGLLTIGPRFGGAIDGAALNWLGAVREGVEPQDFVEGFARRGEYIPGIGHRKYNVEQPDPRVAKLINESGISGRYIEFAKKVAEVTSSKKSQLILNVDGTVAALLLDTLENDEKLSYREIEELLDTGFSNSLFVLARTVGLIAHYLEQRRLDEGLFRLPKEDITTTG